MTWQRPRPLSVLAALSLPLIILIAAFWCLSFFNPDAVRIRRAPHPGGLSWYAGHQGGFLIVWGSPDPFPPEKWDFPIPTGDIWSNIYGDMDSLDLTGHDLLLCGYYRPQQGIPGLAIPQAYFCSHLLLMIPTGIAPALSLFSLWRRRRREIKGRCGACGYDLRASPLRCPECGAERIISGAAAGIN
jgi:hypothetical protein